jgi:hypothetical protein
MNGNWNFVYSALIKKMIYKNYLGICAYLFNIIKQIKAGVHGLMMLLPIRYPPDNEITIGIK